ncbi:MAG: hypothetical protein QM726_14140 [Chitinophagaceae bacterium]
MNQLNPTNSENGDSLFKTLSFSVRALKKAFSFSSTIGYKQFSFTRTGNHPLPVWNSHVAKLNENKLSEETAATIEKNGTLSFTELPFFYQANTFPVRISIMPRKKVKMIGGKQVAPNSKPLVHNGFVSVNVAHFNC